MYVEFLLTCPKIGLHLKMKSVNNENKDYSKAITLLSHPQ